jgi:hypothetical protein
VTDDLCPSCGEPRVGSFRFCRKCKFDFESTAAPGLTATPPLAAPVPTPAAPSPVLSARVPRPKPPEVSAPPTARSQASLKAPTQGSLEPDPTAAPSVPAESGPDTEDRRLAPYLLAIPVVMVGLVLVGLIGQNLLGGSPAPTGPAVGSGSPGPQESTAPAPSAGGPSAFEPIKLSGSGNKDVKFTIPAAQASIAAITNKGDGAFVVSTLSSDGTVQQELVKTSGSYTGTRLIDAPAKEASAAFRVQSAGKWTITISSLSAATAWDRSAKLSGKGEDIVRLTSPTTGSTKITIGHTGGTYLAVHAYTETRAAQPLNGFGKIDTSVPLPEGTFILEITGSGPWTLTP